MRKRARLGLSLVGSLGRPVIHRIMTDCRAVAASSRVSKSRPKGLNHDSVTAFGSRLRTEYCLDNNEGDGNKPFLKFSWDAFVSTSASASCASGNYRSLRGKFDIPREIYSKLHLRILSLMHVAMAKSVMGKSVMGTVISSAICHQYVMSQHCTILRGLLDCGMLLSGFPLLINAQCNVAPVECCPCRLSFSHMVIPLYASFRVAWAPHRYVYGHGILRKSGPSLASS